MVGKLVSFWDAIVSGAMLVSRECSSVTLLDHFKERPSYRIGISLGPTIYENVQPFNVL